VRLFVMLIKLLTIVMGSNFNNPAECKIHSIRQSKHDGGQEKYRYILEPSIEACNTQVSASDRLCKT